MAGQGLVRRQPSPEDGRGYYVVATRLGRNALRRASPRHLRGIAKHFTSLADRGGAEGGRRRHEQGGGCGRMSDPDHPSSPRPAERFAPRESRLIARVRRIIAKLSKSSPSIHRIGR